MDEDESSESRGAKLLSPSPQATRTRSRQAFATVTMLARKDNLENKFDMIPPIIRSKYNFLCLRNVKKCALTKFFDSFYPLYPS